MVSEIYAKAFKEIIELLKYTRKSDVIKIPKEKITMWKTNMDENWNFTVDTSKKLEEQNILPETRAIMANIFYDYWATDYQKQRIDEKDRQLAELKEQDKKEKYNPDSLFKGKMIKSIGNDNIECNTNLLTTIKEDVWYKKLFIKIKGILGKKEDKSRKIKSIENNINMIKTNMIRNSLFGFFVGDALGVPVEFSYRDILEKNPVKDMMEYGSHYQPKGTWSDDSSMVLATMDGLINSENANIDYKKIMMNFLKWQQDGEFTPNKKVFDIGNTTNLSLKKYQTNIAKGNSDDYLCGVNSIESNGNGSLMRILPIAFYLYFANIKYDNDEFWNIIKNISSMTHSHIYSIMGCYIYCVYVNELLKSKNKNIAYTNLKLNIQKVIDSHMELQEMKIVYGRLIYNDISKFNSKDIKSSGYVVDTLESVFWALLTSNSFESSVLKAVNLGDDTDTIGALTGGLAGIIYTMEDNEKWINNLQRVNYLNDMIESFTEYLNKIQNNSKKINIEILNITIDDLKNNPDACKIEKTKFNKNEIKLGYSIAGEKLSNFEKYMYENNLIDKNYLENHKKIKDKSINDMDYNEVMTYLTYCFRGERFCNGFLYSVYEDGTILKLLEKLYEIIEEK